MFYRVFLQSNSNTKRGATGDGSPRDYEKVWYNPITGIIVHEHQNGTMTSYHVSNIEGDGFKVHFFDKKNILFPKTFDEIIGVPPLESPKVFRHEGKKQRLGSA
jgi:hypothetical protein